MKKTLVGLMSIFFYSMLYAQSHIHTTNGKFINAECADFCFLSFETPQGEQTFCVTERNYPNVSMGTLYNITWKNGVIKLQDVSPIYCQEIIKVKVVR